MKTAEEYRQLPRAARQQAYVTTTVETAQMLRRKADQYDLAADRAADRERSRQAH